VGDGVSLGPNQEQHRDYLDWASAAHGGGADACCCCGQFLGDGGAKAHSIHVFRELQGQQRSRGRADGCQKLDEHITSELSEFLDFCNRFVTTLDQALISGAKDDTSAMIFWLKTKADFLDTRSNSSQTRIGASGCIAAIQNRLDRIKFRPFPIGPAQHYSKRILNMSPIAPKKTFDGSCRNSGVREIYGFGRRIDLVVGRPTRRTHRRRFTNCRSDICPNRNDELIRIWRST
jgi:hypothetical protein